MKLDVYGRFQLEVLRKNDAWTVYRLEPGKRMRDASLIIPAWLEAAEVPGFIDDIYHELSGPGDVVRVVP